MPIKTPKAENIFIKFEVFFYKFIEKETSLNTVFLHAVEDAKSLV